MNYTIAQTIDNLTHLIGIMLISACYLENIINKRTIWSYVRIFNYCRVYVRKYFFETNRNLNVIFSFCREINGEKKNFCLVTNPRKKLKYRMFTGAES